jgi:hypothetical protein
MKWIKTTKHIPDTDRQVLALTGTCVQLASFREGKWWLSYSIGLNGVSRWMEVPGEPKDFEYWMNRIRGWWKRQKGNAEAAGDWLTGWGSSKAQLSKKPVFYRSASGQIMSGMPENIAAPYGYEKIVCGSAREAERYSEMQRRQERVTYGRQQEERGMIEGQFRDEIRSEMRTKYANARNPINREFMRRALERNANSSDPTRYERESYLHVEGYEQGH